VLVLGVPVLGVPAVPTDLARRARVLVRLVRSRVLVSTLVLFLRAPVLVVLGERARSGHAPDLACPPLAGRAQSVHAPEHERRDGGHGRDQRPLDQEHAGRHEVTGRVHADHGEHGGEHLTMST
jgi:hypothetical protein